MSTPTHTIPQTLAQASPQVDSWHGLLDRLFGAQSLSFAGEGVRIGFAHQFPLWAWVLIAASCFFVAGWSYYNLLGSKQSRVILAILRGLLLFCIALMIAQPRLEKSNERVEPDWLVVLADRSASMTVADGGANAQTREDELNNALRAMLPTLTTLSEKRRVLMLGFDGTTRDLDFSLADGAARVNLGTPTGQRTAIGESLDSAMKRVAARPVAGVVLLSDGRSADEPSRAVMRQLEGREIPVFTVPLGQEDNAGDVAISRLEAPTAAFVGDLVPVTLNVRGVTRDAVTVELVDDATGEVLDRRVLEPKPQTDASAAADQTVTLTAKPASAKEAAWSVRVVTTTPDVAPQNNQASFRLELSSEPVRVVYLDGYPRWEYRYLKNLLVRESSIKSSIALLASDRRYIQEGSDPLTTLPRTAEDWSKFDVVMLGDLRPNVMTDEQLLNIRTMVAERGAGLLLIGGPSSMPNAWRGTPIADLIPFTLNPSASSGDDATVAAHTAPVLIERGPAAARYGVMQLGESPQDPWPTELSNPQLGWTTLRYAQRIAPSTLKPTAEVLATASPVGSNTNSQMATPLVVTMRYGAGRVVYVATDETWRLRYGRGETFPERIWVPLVRLLARESFGRTGKKVILDASPQTAAIGQQVTLTLRLLDQSLIERSSPEVAIRVSPALRSGSISTEDAARVTMRPQGSASVYTATYTASRPGVFAVDSTDPLLSDTDARASFEVVIPDDELRQPQADHALLAKLSKATGGQVLTVERLKELPTLLPNREVRILGTPDTESLWDKPAVWILLILLLATEWIGRRLIKLT